MNYRTDLLGLLEGPKEQNGTNREVKIKSSTSQNNIYKKTTQPQKSSEKENTRDLYVSYIIMPYRK